LIIPYLCAFCKIKFTPFYLAEASLTFMAVLPSRAGFR
jgi:hypothetical protein